MATVTASTYLKEPKYLHTGLQIVRGQYNSNLSTGDILKLCKIPDRAILDGVTFSRFTGTGGDLIVRIKLPMVGDSGTASETYVALTGLTSSATGSLGSFLSNDDVWSNYQISISDAVIVKEADLEVINASASTTATVFFSLVYHCDEG